MKNEKIREGLKTAAYVLGCCFYNGLNLDNSNPEGLRPWERKLIAFFTGIDVFLVFYLVFFKMFTGRLRP